MPSHWIALFAVALGSALGGMLRYWIRESMPHILPIPFPVATLLVNLVGCFMAGFLLIYWQQLSLSPYIKTAVMVGFLGALTTFSAFSLDTLLLVNQGFWLKAGWNIILNVLLSLLAVFTGAWLGGKISQ